jgi:superfamily II DNA or RNA helicase
VPEQPAARLLAALGLPGPSGIGEGDGEEWDVASALDALLLAAVRSSAEDTGDHPAGPPPATEELPADEPVPTESPSDDPADLPGPEPVGGKADTTAAVSVWLKDDSAAASIPASPVSMGRARALPNALEIGRALRPLRRPRPSRARQGLDLDATVDHYTRTGVLVPRLVPVPEPWQEAVVVVDRGTSMAVWDETVRALTKVLRTLSAFRSIQVWHLEHPSGAAPLLRDHRGHALPRDPSHALHRQPAHRLLLVVSDCAAPAWREEILWRTLHTWGLTAPVALVNPLPKRLWQRSGLDLPRTTATAPVPASPGRLLAYRRPRLLPEDAPGTHPWQALPVLQFDPGQMLSWARTVMRTDPHGCAAVLVPASGSMPSRSRAPHPSDVRPDTHAATDIRATAAAVAFTDNPRSPAVRLAVAASSLEAFTLPVLDVLRERLVPEAAVADIAEFLTAGLLTAARQEDAELVYRFHPAAAGHLRGLLSRDQAWDAHVVLTDHLAAHPQAPRGILAALHSPESREHLPAGLRPLAQAAAATARLLGLEPAEPAEPTPARYVPSSAQREMLDRLDAEREIHGRHRNLLVAVPGTGKTVMSAFDYRRLREKHQRDLRLLFVADRIELLDQARQVYEDVLLHPGFGESLYGGAVPAGWNHVFATVQSLGRHVGALAPDHFDVIVIDEFRGAATPTYRRILDHFRPLELLGLTATPERVNGMNIQDVFFDGRIAAEMRLRDALESDQLTPLHYFGFGDGIDYRSLDWRRGEYDGAALSSLLSADGARARLVLRAVRDTIVDPRAMRAVGFCVSVAHAEFMAQCFRGAGLDAVALSSRLSHTRRQAVFSSLRAGELQAVFCVDLLDEQHAIPEVDTLLLLRPKSSTVGFLQQLSVGLRRTADKAVLTVLDFIGYHRKEFRLDNQFRAMTSLTRRQLLDQIEHFPHLPTGCSIVLDDGAKMRLADHIRAQLGASFIERAREVAEYEEPLLGRYLRRSGREITELYQGRSVSWTGLLRRIHLLPGDPPDGEEALLARVRAFLHVDDPERVQAYTRMLEDDAPHYGDLDERDRAYARMLFFQLWPLGGITRDGFTSYDEGFAALRRQDAFRAELRQVLAYNLECTTRVPIPLRAVGGRRDVPLTVHASYTREEILSALNEVEIRGPLPTDFRQGVKWCESTRTDALFITRAKDYALSPTLFHWESPSHTSETSRTGLRYRNHVEMGTDVLLFLRPDRTSDIGSPQPWTFLGPAEYASHTGSSPMAVTWRLRRELPAAVWSYARIS